MRFKSFLLVAGIIALLTACGSKEFTVSGESEHWLADVNVSQTNDGYETQELLLTYTGDDMESVGEFNYNVDSVGSFGKSGNELEGDGTFVDKNEANPTNAKVTEQTDFEVTIEWDGKTETIQLNQQ
ncbi:hypothetical protein KP77_04920 [Jeotgalibacillus alimentarius]|uniref:Lipoprotein n=1 Tax=Jeotgalibacillus alimentarius TaxID=135826 RepID=A0A0C2WAC9_9BACL|nr:hypothetical protein [Jeotgalibacillus alimentarius]KIL53516.1 hypothetical protein KP77_04920 [Jeotgalibacillus alimentarius]